MTRHVTDSVSRRTYLQLTGGSAVAGLTATAGCLGGDDLLTPGTAPGFPPFEMIEDGELVGYDIDLLEAVVAETDYELDEWEEFEFSSLIPALQNERIDVIAAAMTITEDRQESIAFSNPYYSADQTVLVREGGDFQPTSFGDFDGVTVGAQEGTTGAGVVESELIEPGIITEDDFSRYGNYVLAVQDLENENIDAIVLDQPVAETFAAQRDVEVAFVFETGEQFGFGIRQADEDVQAGLNDGLAVVQDDGTYEEITARWFGE
ncbi:polar amino acid transport system substrate-binding protein [Halalkaliarchaeum desulfuricum]|uniref:Polar amino acid transport system substrate-binding protein n=1 Tax=Halalkaliarchaeum desulfuricum TaxID=2055893 RepID=A0A343TG28_9EURY|nr:transporter substrate-binding domain-containing protein [Halalkaliarchaeum desulfuricum]AUX08050.1 polar amino acid transport system substrate-binding protein [Halalkaliarchaeum desulfuricum]